MSKPTVSQPRLESLLLVDDDVLYLRALERLLSGHYTIVAMTSAARALDRVADSTVAIVVSDYDLGAGPNGVDLLRRFHAVRPEVRRVLISSHCFAHLVEDDNGVIQRFVHKSSGAEKLLACLRELVGR